MAGYGNPNLGPGPGRPKGLKTKRVWNTETLINSINGQDYEPVREQIALYRDPTTPASIKFKINETFLKLIYPAVKAVEHSGTIEHNSLQIQMTVQEASTYAALNVDASVDTSVPSVELSVDDDAVDDDKE